MTRQRVFVKLKVEEIKEEYTFENSEDENTLREAFRVNRVDEVTDCLLPDDLPEIIKQMRLKYPLSIADLKLARRNVMDKGYEHRPGTQPFYPYAAEKTIQYFDALRVKRGDEENVVNDDQNNSEPVSDGAEQATIHTTPEH